MACNLKLAGLPSYTCRACGFHLHEKCSELPQKIKHPFDQIHLLTLIPSPQYPEGLFRCDACGKDGNGFSYHCGDCGIDLHTICANMPSRISHHSHPQHELRLTFFIPDSSRSFFCRICQGTGSNSWMYSCQECRFNAHLICARKRIGQTSRASSNPAQNIINNNNYMYQTNPPPQVVAAPLFRGQANLIPNLTPPTVNPNIRTALASFHQLMNSNSIGFDPSSTQGLDPSMFSGFDFSNLAGIDPSVFAGIDPSALAGVLGFF
ncbi:PREDICTED: uncharacterized protein LOC104827679 [Tarenaya hassleriana]|uniref:uncharacterized protein LOC104827679 n=1 Tax=Tarenaya hassleriana TaxID=28532 RepID=UPI00053C6173|nr:PREDICTED: uncharacterized protein LOC104827679 [Tarenaya hassleriana]